MRERGLKRQSLALAWTQIQSLPMRERGLKLLDLGVELLDLCRSPCGSVD